jgi:hypothetical protein
VKYHTEEELEAVTSEDLKGAIQETTLQWALWKVAAEECGETQAAITSAWMVANILGKFRRELEAEAAAV